MSAERIARAVQRLKGGLVEVEHGFPDKVIREANAEMVARFRSDRFTTGAIVDMTAIYNDFLGSDNSLFVYEDTMMAPPLDEATFCYYSASGDFVGMLGASTYLNDRDPDGLFELFRWTDDERGETDHPIDWDAVKWITATALWIDRKGEGMVLGPVMSWRFAVYADGSLADLHWVMYRGHDEHKWDNAMSVFMKAVTWMNCRNIELVQPHRPRPQQRRLDRTGVEVKEIHIRPVGKTYQYDERTKVGSGLIPLHTVRGHIALYGIDGRKKLFGKITGRFWIPMHSRGNPEHGETNPTRILETT